MPTKRMVGSKRIFSIQYFESWLEQLINYCLTKYKYSFEPKIDKNSNPIYLKQKRMTEVILSIGGQRRN